MAHYIDKSSLVVELKRRIDEYNIPVDRLGSNNIRLHECKDILSFLDTLEVKEVDLEKENLTWKDIRELYIIFAEVDAEIEFCKTDIQVETIGYYQEVLKRFKAQKGE